MTQRTKHHALTLCLLATLPASSAVLSGGPDAWSRGDTGSAYFGWDVFEVTGPPGMFGDVQLNDSTPDIGSGPSGAVITQGNPDAYGLRSTSSNIYSGFLGNQLDIDLTVPTIDTSGSGTTTILLTILGNPALTRDLENFTLTDSSSSFAPSATLTGESLERPGQKVWAAEWQISNNSSSSFTIDILSDLASGNGTDVAFDSVTIDTFWSDSIVPENTSTALALGTVTIPEPSSACLATLALGLICTRRQRSKISVS